jgi:tRNA modification GTPase
VQTIAAIASHGGANAISIVRLCGVNANSIALKITKKHSLLPRYAHFCKLFDANSQMLDEAIVIYFKAPFSYNGEDIVEFQCHGGSMAAKMIFAELLALGATVAQPGEFTKLAVVNGKMTLSKAEAIYSMINSTNEKSVKILSKQMQGSLGEFVHSVRVALYELMAYAEVNIDYGEEDLPIEIVDMIGHKADNLALLLQETLLASKRRQTLFGTLKISIIGKPNVGKSSLLNTLLSYERAIVSDMAGTTRDTVEELLNIGHYCVRVVDTAGIRGASDKVEQKGIEYSRRAYDESDIVLVLFDGSREFDADDSEVLSLAASNPQKPALAVINKSDLEPKIDFSHFDDMARICISTKQNCRELETKIKDILDAHYDDGGYETLISQRQMSACELAIGELGSSLEYLQSGELELFSFHIKESVKAIGAITSGYDNEEMLDKMFGEFCLGK